MRLVAATFSDESSAQQVLEELRERYRLRATDADLAPLGTAGRDDDRRIVLAGRFHEAVVPDVERIIEGSGGAVVAEVDEDKAEHPANGQSAARSH